MSNPNKTDQMKNLAIILLVALISVFATYTFVSKNSNSSSPSTEIEKRQQRVQESEKGKKEEDPYIANQVKNRIIKNAAEIQSCYKEFLKEKPEVKAGLMIVDWQISAEGKVKSPEVVSSVFKSDGFKKCMVDKVNELEFPPPPSGFSKYVAHKFYFKEDEGDQEGAGDKK